MRADLVPSVQRRCAPMMLLLCLAACAVAPLARSLMRLPTAAFEGGPAITGPHASAGGSPIKGSGPWPTEGSRGQPIEAAPEWPTTWEGRPLRPLAPSAVEQRFAAQFPGRVARLTDGDALLVWRDVQAPTRMLHPAADCFRALGYRIENAALEHDAQRRLWRCFVAQRGTQGLRVCERIVDADGLAFTDSSSWYWAAQLGRSRGPWQAITVTRAL